MLAAFHSDLVFQHWALTLRIVVLANDFFE